MADKTSTLHHERHQALERGVAARPLRYYGHDVLPSARLTSQYDFRQHDYSLDELIEADTGDMVSRAKAISAEEYLIHTGRLDRPVIERLELRIDVRCAVSLLPTDLQNLCARLQEQTIVDIAHEDGVSRHKIDELRRRIGLVFLEHGLDEYL